MFRALPYEIAGASSMIGRIISIDEWAERMQIPDRHTRGILAGERVASLLGVQSKSWDPLVDWLQNQLNTTLLISYSLVPVEQSSDLEKGLSKLLLPIEPLSLTAMNELVTLSNSLIIGLALLKGKISPEKAWNIMRIEEEWQRTIWGTLAEQKAEDKIKRSLFMHACEILQMVQKV